MKLLSSLLLAVLPCAALLQQPAQDAPPRAVVGAAAPTCRLNDHTGKIAALGGASERGTIMAFFPKAATPG
jgi:hypothetical protein